MTLVIDASATAELLLGRAQGLAVMQAIGDEPLVAPQLLVAECLSVLRGWTLSGQITPARAEAALVDLNDLGVTLFDLSPLAWPAWQWRHNLSAYDACYVALAEALDCGLVTTDRRLAAAVGDRAVTL